MFKLLLASSAIATVLVLSQPTKADIINVGLNPTSATGHFSNDVGGGAFADQITFQLSGFPQFITFASATNDFIAATDFITNFAGRLFNAGADLVPGGGDDVAAGPLVLAVGCPTNPTGCQILAGSATLDPGYYFLDITGTGGGTSGYGGDITTHGVPGPVLGGGLPGLIAAIGGWLAWRRRPS